MAETKVAVPEVEQMQQVTIGVDRSYEQVLQLNMDESVELLWVPKEGAFRRLPPSVAEQLKPSNMRNYLIAETKFDALQKHKVKVITNPFNPLGSDAEYRERIRARPGWHQCWASPGQDYEVKTSGQYVPVRKLGDNQKAGKCLPGEENGEIIKRLVDRGNIGMEVEAIAVECPQHLYEQYLQWMSDSSVRKRMGVKGEFFGKVEDINRELPRDKRILPIDDEGDMQA